MNNITPEVGKLYQTQTAVNLRVAGTAEYLSMNFKVLEATMPFMVVAIKSFADEHRITLLTPNTLLWYYIPNPCNAAPVTVSWEPLVP